MPSMNSTLRGQDLEQFLASDEPCTKSVIVEVKRPKVPAPGKRAERTLGSARALLPKRPREVSAPASARAAASTDLSAGMMQVRSVLEGLGLAEGARAADRIGYYVVDVTPHQLQQLARSPAVQAIRANKLHRKI